MMSGTTRDWFFILALSVLAFLTTLFAQWSTKPPKPPEAKPPAAMDVVEPLTVVPKGFVTLHGRLHWDGEPWPISSSDMWYPCSGSTVGYLLHQDEVDGPPMVCVCDHDGWRCR